MKYFVKLNVILKARRWQRGMRDDTTQLANAYQWAYHAQDNNIPRCRPKFQHKLQIGD